MLHQHIDLSYLERLYKGDRARMVQWIRMYLEETPDYFRKLSHCLITGDAAGLAAAAHDLRPQAHYVGASRMLELLIAIGQKAHGSGTEACADLVDEIMSLSHVVDTELRSVIKVG